MASWFRDAADMHTRLFVSNLEVPEQAVLCQQVTVSVSLLDWAGAELADRRFTLPRNATFVLELADLLPGHGQRGDVQSGRVVVDFEGPQLGSSRAYLHWYNERSLTSSHEKYGLTIAGRRRLLDGSQCPGLGPEYRVYLAVTNLDQRPYLSDVTLKDNEGHALAHRGGAAAERFALPRVSTRSSTIRAAFSTTSSGVLYFGNNRQPAMYYYFVRNQRLGTWRAHWRL